MTGPAGANAQTPDPDTFFGRLRWLDGRPLLDTIEDYRRDLFMRALFTFRDDGSPAVNLVLSGRAKKNWKSADLILAALYRLLMWVSPFGNDGFIIANAEDQAGDDLELAKKLVAANPVVSREVECLTKEIRRRDGAGSLTILPSRDVASLHGKSYLFGGYDEIHGYRNWDVFEALQPDPHRSDALQWITSYDTIFSAPGVPLFDMKAAGFRGDDPRMLFSWYSADKCTDPAFADLPPEQRANPSMGSWPEGQGYLDQQRRRLPSTKYRRLHLNLPGAPSGAFLEPAMIDAAVVQGRRSLPPRENVDHVAFVDMSGGSADDAVLAIAHKEPDGRAVLDCIMPQMGAPPFNPRMAVVRFAATMKVYGIAKVTGDNYAGDVFKHDFEAEGIRYEPSRLNKTDIYEAFEPELNAGNVELLDVPNLTEQLLGLVVRGARVDHAPGEHDDFSNAAAGAIVNAVARQVAQCSVAFTRDGTGVVFPSVGERQPEVTRGEDGIVRLRYPSGREEPANSSFVAGLH